MQNKQFKQRKCKVCEIKFQPLKPFQAWCSPNCAYEYQKILKSRKEEKERRDKKKEFLTHKDYIQLLQKVFNNYIRARDKELGCISCGEPLNSKYDAGHFFPTTYQFLRFNEDNVHGQCVHCNQHKHGNIQEYSIGIEKRIGFERTQKLFLDRHKRLEFTIPDMLERIKYYKDKIRSMKNKVCG